MKQRSKLHKIPIAKRVEVLLKLGYQVEKCRYNGRMKEVGSQYYLPRKKEWRMCIEAPRGKFFSAWCIISPTRIGFS